MKENEDSEETSDAEQQVDKPLPENTINTRREDNEQQQILHRGTIEHFSKPLSSIQKKDLKHLYIGYLKEQFLQNKTPTRKIIIESPCEILDPLSNCKGYISMTNYELVFYHEMEMNDIE